MIKAKAFWSKLKAFIVNEQADKLIRSLYDRISIFLKKVTGTTFRFPTLRKSILKLRIPVIAIGLIVSIAAVLWMVNVYKMIYKPNARNTTLIFISSGMDYAKVLEMLKNKNVLEDISSFNWLARKLKYPVLIKPGAYKIIEGWSNEKIINMLRSGVQTPVNVIFNSIRTREELAGRLARSLEADSVSFLQLLNSDSLANVYGLTHESFPCIFIPNTYQFYWTTSPVKFVERMKKEYDYFWTESRKRKAVQIGLSISQVSVLASIIQEETNMKDEKSRIAGVYLNRLNHDWLLQADPTIKYAIKDFSVKRILTAYTDIDSPYNTYKYKGLPPGPINFPEIENIDAVLNAEKHDYMYFCAKDDFSGYHYFSKTLSEHNMYASKYRKALNRNRIFN